MDEAIKGQRPRLTLVSDNPNPTPAPSMPIEDVYQYWAPHLAAMSAPALRSVLVDLVDSGPATLLQAIEAEFAKRGIDPFTLEPMKP
ncbi:hypothetical protein IAG41_16050 [Sphingomonas sp. JC676]|uniref:hypothetical protein n=1 Tax=Sphingomonas sp. JC676 TaxID=2768065 RepID=UPI0016584197|nr:hypothetical protein [Sphingomonas sp. JC676]MBC9033906.1 hypothetical protein [Sphingomonas sp. JC676]